MNSCSRRFLAINCVLQGYSFLDAYDGDSDLAAKDLVKGDVGHIESYVKRLNSLQKTRSFFADADPLVLTLLKFLRIKDYAFTYIPNSGPFFIETVAVSERKGEIPFDITRALLAMLIKDIDYVDNDSAIQIVDGKLSVPKNRENDISNALIAAYRYYCYGPVSNGKYCNEVITYKPNFVLENYKNFTAKMVLSVFDALLKCGFPPTDYTTSVLSLPDYLPIYKKTGTVLVESEDGLSFLWLLDVAGESKATTVMVPKSVVRSLLMTSLDNLSTIDYVAGGPNSGLHVKG